MPLAAARPDVQPHTCCACSALSCAAFGAFVNTARLHNISIRSVKRCQHDNNALQVRHKAAAGAAEAPVHGGTREARLNGVGTRQQPQRRSPHNQLAAQRFNRAN